MEVLFHHQINGGCLATLHTNTAGQEGRLKGGEGRGGVGWGEVQGGGGAMVGKGG